MFCHKCGAAAPAGVRFCNKCGALLPVLTYQRDDNVPQTLASAEPVPSISPSGTKKRSMSPILAIGAALIVLIVAIGIYYNSGTAIKGKADSVYYLEAYDAQNNPLASGSGFLIGDGSDLVTNYHVIEDATKIVAISSDNSEKITLRWVSAYSRFSDLAILHSSTPLKAAPLTLADSDSVEQGDKVYAIGYPLGLSNTLSDGIVSARYMDAGIDTLQITAAISPGSSGGALLNSKGNVIGVICAYYDGGQNLNVAIASNVLKNLYNRRGELKRLSSVS